MSRHATGPLVFVTLAVTLGLQPRPLLADGTARALATRELREQHRGDGQRYGVSRRPAYDHAGLTAWPIVVNGRQQATALLVRREAAGPRVIGMAELRHVRPGDGGADLVRVDGRAVPAEHVVRAQGFFRPTLATLVTAPASATVQPHGNARSVGRTVGLRRQALLVAPLSAADVVLRVAAPDQRRASLVVSPFPLVSPEELGALVP